MKNLIYKNRIWFLIVMLFVVTNLISGCNESEIFELNIGAENPEIEHEVDGVKLTFCLLNEQDEPSTKFNVGEEISFRFSIANHATYPIYFDNKIYNAKGFCEVRNRRRSFGMSYQKPVIIDKIGTVVFKIPEEYSVENEIDGFQKMTIGV